MTQDTPPYRICRPTAQCVGRRGAAGIVMITATLFGLVACQPTQQRISIAGGPLAKQQTTTTQCEPNPDRQVIAGGGVINGTEASPTYHLTSITLVNAKHISLQHAWLVRIRDKDDWGASAPDKTAIHYLNRFDYWSRRAAITASGDATMPAKTPAEYDIVVAVTPRSTGPASYTGLALTYNIGPTKYRYVLTHGLKLPSRSCIS